MKQKLLLIFTVLFSSLAASAYDFKSGMFCYNVISEEDRTVELTGEYDGTFYELEEVSIPAAVTNKGKTYTVTRIGDEALVSYNFHNDKKYKLYLPYTLTSIGKRAFEGQNMSDVNIPESVMEIGANAFSSCEYLPIRNQMRYAGTYLVRYEPRLYDEDKQEFVYEDGELVYDKAERFLIMPGTRFIGGSAFAGFNNERETNQKPHPRITLPSSVEVIGGGAFADNDMLQEIDLGGNVRLIEEWAFFRCTNLRVVYNSQSVEEIGDGAFCELDNFQEIDLPNIKKVGNRAFADCQYLEISGLACVEEIGESAFERCWVGISELKLPNTLKTLGNAAFSNCNGIYDVELPNSLTIIDGTFYNCSNLRSVQFSDALEKIYGPAFHGTCLKEIHLPKSIKLIDQTAFVSWENTLELITIDAEVPPTAYETNTEGNYMTHTFSTFSDHTYQNATLVVPEGSEAAYRNATCWRKFNKIVTSGIDGVQMDEPANSGKTYNIQGWPIGEDYKGVIIRNGNKMLVK